jgi:hypothetical protein
VSKVGRSAETSDYLTADQQARDLFESWEQDILQPLEVGFRRAQVLAVFGQELVEDPTLVDPLVDAIPEIINARNCWGECIFNQGGPISVSDEEFYSALMHRRTAAVSESELRTFAAFELNRLAGGAPFATSNGLFGFSKILNLLETSADVVVCLFEGCRAPFSLMEAQRSTL